MNYKDLPLDARARIGRLTEDALGERAIDVAINSRYKLHNSQAFELPGIHAQPMTTAQLDGLTGQQRKLLEISQQAAAAVAMLPDEYFEQRNHPPLSPERAKEMRAAVSRQVAKRDLARGR